MVAAMIAIKRWDVEAIIRLGNLRVKMDLQLAAGRSTAVSRSIWEMKTRRDDLIGASLRNDSAFIAPIVSLIQRNQSSEAELEKNSDRQTRILLSKIEHLSALVGDLREQLDLLTGFGEDIPLN